MNRRAFFKSVQLASTISLASLPLVNGFSGLELYAKTFNAEDFSEINSPTPSKQLHKKFSSHKINSDKTIVVDTTNINSLSDASEENISSHDKFNFNLDDIVLSNSKFKVLGVTHDFENYFIHEKEIIDLVKNSKFVVLEYFKDVDYYGLVADVCKYYDKPIIRVDNQSDSLVKLETNLGFFGSLLTAGSLLKSNMLTSRRDALKTFSLGALGFYLWTSSTFHSLTSLYRLPDNLSLNHTIDHRDVEFTLRLKNLNNLIYDGTISKARNLLNEAKGDYILVNVGNFHHRGLLHYSDNLFELEFKKDFYDMTYGLADNNDITCHYFDGDWKSEVLNQE